MKYLTEGARIFFQRENFFYFLKIRTPLLFVSLLTFIWFLVLRFGAEKLSENFSRGAALFLIMLGLRLVGALVYLFVSTASLEAGRRVVEGLPLSVKEAFLVARMKMWPFFGAGVLRGIILAIGFLLFFIPGVIFAVWFAFVGFGVVLGGKGIREAFARSRALVKGRFWPVFGNLFVIWTFSFLVQIFFSFLPFNLGVLFWPLMEVLFLLSVYLLFKELEGRTQERGRATAPPRSGLVTGRV